jgi:hypothetical protein
MGIDLIYDLMTSAEKIGQITDLPLVTEVTSMNSAK